MAKSEKAKKRGGQREGAGRRPVADPKEEITIYVRKSSIKMHGGKASLKSLLTELAERSPTAITNASEVFSAKVVNPISVKQSMALHNAENKDQMTLGSPMRQLQNGVILKQISDIEAEKIPKERDTTFGRKVWMADQQKRIDKLKAQLK